MTLADKQRHILVESFGEPVLSLEFDVWKSGGISMWTHFNHAAEYAATRAQLIAIRDHLDSFLKAEAMCPFYKRPNAQADAPPTSTRT